MRKTIFEGTINGEVFDSVQAYNARMNELVDAGEVVNASSNTRIEYVDCDCEAECPASNTSVSTNVNTYDEDLSFYPYMEDDDPFYLDLLVATDIDQNRAALDEVDVVLEKCLPFIVDALNDPDTTCKTKKRYLEDVKEILNSLNGDNEDTVKAKNSLLAKRSELTKAFNKVKDKYEEDIHNSLNEEILLNGSFPVISRFKDFYSKVAELTENSIAECDCNGKCDCGACKAKVEETPSAEICEVTPPKIADISTLFEHIFGYPLPRRNSL